MLSKRSSDVGRVERGDGDRIVEDVVQPAQTRRARQDVEFRAHQPQIVALARAEHHAMLAELDRFRIAIDRDMPHGEQAHAGRHDGATARTISSTHTLKPDSVLGPNAVLMATSVASRPRAISTRPMRGTLLRGSKVCHWPSDVGLEPSGEVHRAVRRRHADVAEVAGAVARRDVHAAAERDGQMREVAADALALVEGLPRRLGRARVLRSRSDVAVDVVADRLHAPRAVGALPNSDQAMSDSRSVSQ